MVERPWTWPTDGWSSVAAPPDRRTEGSGAGDGVVETLEYADLNPYLHFLMLDNVPTVTVTLAHSLKVQLPERQVMKLRGFCRDVIRRMKEFDEPPGG